MATPFKIESGVQLLARLTRKLNVENFYPVLFQDGPKQNEVIELYSDNNINSLLNDLICEALLPMCFGGKEFSILLINCNANFDYNSLVSCLKRKISFHINRNESLGDLNDTRINELVKKLMCHIFTAEVYDSSQLYATIHNLESVFLKISNIAMLLFDTITAFYWADQSYKISKMDVYIKTILKMIQKISKEHKITIFYTRPEYFSTSKDSIENLEACSELPVLEKVNYRIQIVQTKEDDMFIVNIRTHDSFYKQKLYMDQNKINWV